jgi:hypothetical protein
LFCSIGSAAPTRAARLHGTMAKTVEPNTFVRELPNAIARVRGALGDAVFDEAIRRGSAMTLHEAADYALHQIGEALAALDARSP